jgi:hypothetical protein
LERLSSEAVTPKILTRFYVIARAGGRECVSSQPLTGADIHAISAAHLYVLIVEGFVCSFVSIAC